ncbi:hypothetical protein EON68_04880, partial [archaeon]
MADRVRASAHFLHGAGRAPPHAHAHRDAQGAGEAPQATDLPPLPTHAITSRRTVATASAFAQLRALARIRQAVRRWLQRHRTCARTVAAKAAQERRHAAARTIQRSWRAWKAARLRVARRAKAAAAAADAAARAQTATAAKLRGVLQLRCEVSEQQRAGLLRSMVTEFGSRPAWLGARGIALPTSVAPYAAAAVARIERGNSLKPSPAVLPGADSVPNGAHTLVGERTHGGDAGPAQASLSDATLCPAADRPTTPIALPPL